MQKLEYIDYVRNTLRQVDKTSKFHHEIVSMAIDMAIQTVFYDMYKANPKEVQKSMERYSTIITNTTVLSAVIGRYQSTFDHEVYDLPTKSSGVLEISLEDTTTTQFVPVTTMEGEQFYGSESSLPGNVIGFTLKGSSTGGRLVEYWGMNAVTDVILRILKRFRGLENDAEFIIPYGQEDRIMELVRQYLGVIPPKDIINNNSDQNG